MQGQIQLALENTEWSLHLSPLDPLLYGNYAIKSFSYLRLGDLPNAVYWAEKAASTPGAHFLIFMNAAAVHALSGDMKKTQYWCARIKARKPDASALHFFSAFPFVDEVLQTALKDGLQRAQL